MATRAELDSRARRLLAELSLCASAPAGAPAPTARPGRPGSQAPRHVDDVVGYHRERFTSARSNDELEKAVRDCRDELAALKTRPDAAVKTETFPELAARIVEHGEGFSTLDVAVATRSSEAVVRKVRLLAGREAETGRPLPLEAANGHPLEWALTLCGAGYSLRAASMLSGVARSTIHEHLGRDMSVYVASRHATR